MTLQFSPFKTLLALLPWAVVSAVVLALAAPAYAEMRPTLNFYGTTGLIEMPSGEAQPDGYLGISSTHFGPMSRTTLSFQIAPRLSGSFRYTATRNWNDLFCPPDCTAQNAFSTYLDRGFDLKFLVLKESNYLPSVSVGFQDFVGTGIQSGEYIVATKRLTPQVKVTAGLGWGRLGSNGPIGAPFGARPPLEIGEGGNFNISQWFRGDMAPFGGIEWQVNDKWAVKAEYSSDAYLEEATKRATFDHRSPFNFGVEYQRSPSLRLGAYYMYGSEIGIAAHLVFNPDQRLAGGIGGTGPAPVLPRPARADDPEAWSPEWVTQADAKSILIESLAKHLERSGILVEALGYTGDTAQLRIRNNTYDAEAQAIGRAARAMTQVMPASIETFEIIPMVNGVPASKVTIKRSDIEALEFAPDGAAILQDRIKVSDAGNPIAGLGFNPKIYPRFEWSVAPYVRLRLFSPGSPVAADFGLRVAADYEIRRGVILSGTITKKLAGNLGLAEDDSVSSLPPVRTDIGRYDALGDPGLETLTAAWYGRLGTNLYGRLTVGYLERMFGGVSGEVLWKPADRRWALGAELNYVAQRDSNQGFGFGEYDYSLATGQVSGYLDLGKGYHAQLDVGRYLAGDDGATLSLDRYFENGWKVGAFVTLTDVPAEDFDSGSFDKGIRLEIPLSWFTGRPSRATKPLSIGSIPRDGGARLEIDGRLYDTLQSYDESGLDAQWGRFWK